jgi:hypothetical protein
VVGRCMSADAPVGESGSDDILGAIETAVDRDDSHGAPQPNCCRAAVARGSMFPYPLAVAGARTWSDRRDRRRVQQYGSAALLTSQHGI